jgi:hypothetical protein
LSCSRRQPRAFGSCSPSLALASRAHRMLMGAACGGAANRRAPCCTLRAQTRTPPCRRKGVDRRRARLHAFAAPASCGCSPSCKSESEGCGALAALRPACFATCAG